MNEQNEPDKLASWEKHTKGIGSKLLQKFGFSGRLGAKETGISQAIEATVRPVGVGLGFGNADSKANSESFEIQREQKDFKIDKKRKSPHESKVHNKRAKKTSHQRNIIENLLNEGDFTRKRVEIVDMTKKRKINNNTGSDDDVLSLSDEDEGDNSDESVFNVELDLPNKGEEAGENDTDIIQRYYQTRHFMRFERSSADSLPLPLQDIERRLKDKENQQRILNNKIGMIEHRSYQNNLKLKRLRAISDRLNEVQSFISSLYDRKNSNIPAEDLIDQYASTSTELMRIQRIVCGIFEDYEEESLLFGMNKIFQTLFHALISSIVGTNFSSLETKKKNGGNLISSDSLFVQLSVSYELWQTLLTDIETFLLPFSNQLQRDALNYSLIPILEKTILSELMTFVLQEYNPIIHTQLLTDYLALLKPYVPVEKVTNLLKISIIPKLLRFIQSWNFNISSQRYVIQLGTNSHLSLSSTVETSERLSGTDDYFLFHHWIIPFISVIHPEQKDLITQLFPEIRRKIVSLIKNWEMKPVFVEIQIRKTNQSQNQRSDNEMILNMKEISVLEQCHWFIRLIAPWKDIFDSLSYAQIVTKALIPRLLQYTNLHFLINPTEQNIHPFQSVLLFEQIIPDDYWNMFLCVSFFPRFLPVLFQWIQSYPLLPASSVNRLDRYNHQLHLLEELLTWYEGWRSLFSKKLFSDKKYKSFRVSRLFERSLEFIEKYLSLFSACLDMSDDGSNRAQSLLESLNQEVTLFLSGVQQLTFIKLAEISSKRSHSGADGVSWTSRVPDAAISSSTVHVTLKDLLEAMAERLNVDFHQNPAKTSKYGKLVYQFGNLLLYVENNVIYIHDERKTGLEDWSPVALDDLQHLAK